MKRRSEIDAAKTLHRAFRDESSRGTKKVSINLPRAGVNMGQVDAIEYTTRQDGKTVPYRHTFKAGSRPMIVAFPKRGMVVLIGRFRVTGRGFVDLDIDGREIDD